MSVTKLKIRIFGDPCLRLKSVPVKEVGPAERVLIAAMIETMHEYKGIGLAAPQVGFNQRIFVADIGNGPIAVINPKIIKRSGSGVLEEGCLSLPGVTVEVRRPKKIFVSYIDENNRRVESAYDELMARVIQHETDHLNGKLITDYLTFTRRRKIEKQLKAGTLEPKKKAADDKDPRR